MTRINFGGVEEEVITRDEFSLEKARAVLKDEVVAVLGYGVQGPAQSLNMRDNGINVIYVGNLAEKPSVSRDLALIKVSVTPANRTEVLQLADVYRARIVDVAPDSLIVEITGTEDKIDSCVDVLRPFGIVEMVRTGEVAMARGSAGLPLVKGTGLANGNGHGRLN